MRQAAPVDQAGPPLLRVAGFAMIAHAVLYELAVYFDALAWTSTLASALTVLVALPFVFTAALGLVSLVLAAILLPIAALARPFGPTGVGGLLAELFAGLAPIVPRYYELLGRVRSPLILGVALGSLTAAAALALRTVAVQSVAAA